MVTTGIHEIAQLLRLRSAALALGFMDDVAHWTNELAKFGYSD